MRDNMVEVDKTHISPREFYEDYGKTADSEKYKLDASWKSQIIIQDIKELNQNIESIVEFGCGQGYVLKGICTEIQPKLSIGIDISKSMLVQAIKENPNDQYILGDVDMIPLKDNSIDIIILCDILEHLSNPKAVVNNSASIGKFLYIKIPLEKCVKNVFSEKLFRYQEYGIDHKAGHLISWNRQDALKFFSQCNLKIIKSHRETPPDHIRYARGRFEKARSQKVLILLEKFLYHRMKRIHELFFGSNLYVICTQKQG